MILQDIDGFKTLLQPAVAYRQPEPALITQYQGILPDIITETWAQSGLMQFYHGFLWMTDPDTLRTEAALLLPDLDAKEIHVFLRTAFGDLIFVYQGFIWSYSVVTGMRFKEVPLAQSNAHLDVSFGDKVTLKESFFLNYFEKARKRLPELKEDEVYAFVPALQMGGTMDAAQLEVQQLHAYLMLIAELSAPE